VGNLFLQIFKVNGVSQFLQKSVKVGTFNKDGSVVGVRVKAHPLFVCDVLVDKDFYIVVGIV
jgi:hypothetical protein